ncbi:MAG: hypothetical protein EBU14_14510, partial [Acetobacteraceae bacterium]|nr:hypothetical protein [Acetobacteraceae bacterium]
ARQALTYQLHGSGDGFTKFFSPIKKNQWVMKIRIKQMIITGLFLQTRYIPCGVFLVRGILGK